MVKIETFTLIQKVGQVHLRHNLVGLNVVSKQLERKYKAPIPQYEVLCTIPRPPLELTGSTAPSRTGSIPLKVIPPQSLIFNPKAQPETHGSGVATRYRYGIRSFTQFVPQYVIMETERQNSRELTGISISGLGRGKRRGHENIRLLTCLKGVEYVNGNFFMLQYQKTVGEVMKLVTLDFQLHSIPSGSIQRKSIVTGKDKLLIKTIKVIPVGTMSSCEVTLVRGAASALDDMAQVVYVNTTEYSTSNSTDGIYDLVDIPYVDEDITKSIHIAVKNTHTSGSAADYRVIIEAIELQ